MLTVKEYDLATRPELDAGVVAISFAGVGANNEQRLVK